MKVLFFAQVREALGHSVLDVDLPEDVRTVDALVRYCVAAFGEQWGHVLDERRVLVAVNQEIVNYLAPISNADEVAFFPPVTGG